MDRERCIRCGECVDACPLSTRGKLSGPLVLPTKKATVAGLWQMLYPQLDMLREIGGLTISGGEPLLQSSTLRYLLRLCREAGIHTAVETSGALPAEHFTDTIDWVNCWLYGLRPTPVYVPPNAGLIRENLALLAEAGSRVIIRTPIIAGITDLRESLEDIAAMMRAHRLTQIELLPFHEGTPHYYGALGMVCPVGREAIPSVERIAAVKEFFEESGFVAEVVR